MNSIESESHQQLLIIKSSTFINSVSFHQFLSNNLILREGSKYLAYLNGPNVA